MAVFDNEGYRANVGIILLNEHNQVFWGKRLKERSWQFPQGGIKPSESAEAAMFRELFEETGLLPQHVSIIGRTRDWLRYDVPLHWVRKEWRGLYRGQKQIWFLLRLNADESNIYLRATTKPEFDDWKWHDYWAVIEEVVDFKQRVYERALSELSRLVYGLESMGEYHGRILEEKKLQQSNNLNN